MTKKLIVIFIFLALTLSVFFFFHFSKTKPVEPPVVPTLTPTQNSVPLPTVTVSASIENHDQATVTELQWNKAFQKIQEEEARLRAQHKTAELSKFETLGYQCDITEHETLIIKNKKSWDTLLHRMGIQTETSLFPDINFHNSMIAAVFTGEKSFTEKLLLIDSQEFIKTTQGKKLLITYRKTFAPKGSTISTIMMQPYHLKIFPTYAGPIEFQEAIK